MGLAGVLTWWLLILLATTLSGPLDPTSHPPNGQLGLTGQTSLLLEGLLHHHTEF